MARSPLLTRYFTTVVGSQTMEKKRGVAFRHASSLWVTAKGSAGLGGCSWSVGPAGPSSSLATSVNIGKSGFGLGRFFLAFCPAFAFFLACRFGFAVRAVFFGGLGAFLFSLGSALVRFAAVIGLVETGALEDDGSARAEEAAQLGLAALRTFLQGNVTHRLKFVETVVAGVAFVFVGGHEGSFLLLKAKARARSRER